MRKNFTQKGQAKLLKNILQREEFACCNQGGGGDTFVLHIADTDTLDLSGNGSAGNPLRGDVLVSGQPNNLISIIDDGLYVGVPDFSIFARNGLNINTGNVELGGPLLRNTEIDQAGSSMTFTQNLLNIENGLVLRANSTAAAANGQKLLKVDLQGVNASANQTTTTGWFSNIHTGSGSRNIGIFSTASGAVENYAGYFVNNIRLSSNPTNEGHRIDIIGDNPAEFRAFGDNMVFSMNGLYQLQMQTSVARWNSSGADVAFEFRICATEDQNTLAVGAGAASAIAHKVGINGEPVRTFDVRTRYTSIHADSLFYIARWTADRFFPNTDPIPVPVVGFGVGHEFFIENAAEINVLSATNDYTTTSVTNGAESVDFSVRLINAGTLSATPRFKVTSGGSIQTVQPSGSGAGLLKVGKFLAAAVTLDTTHYIEIEIDGVIKKLAVLN